MRVTQSMMKTQLVNNINNVLKRLSVLNQQSSTGNKFEYPSQDPTGAFLTNSYNSTLNALSSYKTSLNQVQSTMKGYDSTISQLTSEVQRVQSLVVQASNDTNTASDRSAIADEVKQIRESVAQLGNTRVSTSYIFNGARQSPGVLSTTSGSSTSYYYVSNSVTSSVMKLNIGESSVNSNVTLQQIFGYSGGTVSNSLLSYVTGGGGTTTVAETLSNGSENFSGAGNVNLLSGSMAISGGILNDSVGTPTTFNITGATSIIVNSSSGTTVTSGSSVLNLNSGSITVIGGTVTLTSAASAGSSNSLNVTGDFSVSNASGSSVNIVSKQTAANSDVHLGLLDKIINDLENNDVSALSNQDLGDLESYQNSLQRTTTSVGAREQYLSDMLSSNESFNSYITQLKADTQGADIVKVASDLSIQQMVYQAALQTSAKSLLPTLAEFLS